MARPGAPDHTRSVRHEDGSIPARPLIGRGQELSALTDVLSTAAAGDGRTAVVEGEAGIGKTRLLAEVLRRSRDLGFHVLAGSARELDRDRPFGAIAEALGLDTASRGGRGRAELRRLLASDPGSGRRPVLESPDARSEIVERAVSFVATAASKRPVALAIEDVHWADASSLLVLMNLVRRLDDRRIVVLVTARPAPRTPDLDRTLDRLGLHGIRVALGALPDADVAELVSRELGGAKPGRRLLDAVATAGGNPFFVEELVAAFREEGIFESVDGAADVPRITTPWSLRVTLLHRLSFLNEQTLEVLKIGAVLGSAFSLDDLAVVMGRSGTDLANDLRAAERGGLLDANERFLFRHELVREAIYEDLPEAVRRGLHLQAARALGAADRPASTVATHLAIAAEPGDVDAIRWLWRAGRESTPRAPDTGSRFLGRALDLAHPTFEGREALTGDLVWALLWSGQVAEAERLARESLVWTRDELVQGVLHYAVAKALVAKGSVGESLTHLETALAGPSLPATVRATLLAELALRRLHTRDLTGARTAAEETLEIAEREERTIASIAALACLSWIALFRGDAAGAERLSREAVAAADAEPTGVGQLVEPRAYRALYLIHSDRFDEADEMLRTGLELDRGQVFPPVYLALRAFARYHAGAWDDALEHALRSLELATESGVSVYVVFADALVAHIAFHRDDLEAARSALSEAEAEWNHAAPARFGLAWMMWARALLDEAEGDSAGAVESLQGIWDLGTLLEMPAECPEMGPDLVRLAIATGRREHARTVADDLAGLASGAGRATANALALRARGLASSDPDLLLSAVEAYRGGSRPLELGQSCEEAGALLGELDRLDEARRVLDEALTLYEDLGARRDLARCGSVLRALGLRRGRRGHRGRPSSGWESLTDAERRVVALVSQGLTNRQIAERLFVSRYTVETHLSHVFAKLNLTSRAQLAAEAARRGE